MAFQPRGLIETPSREDLWNETRSKALGLCESKTFELWEDILHDVFIRRDHGYYVNSHQPPEDGSRKYFIVSAKSRGSGNKKIRLVIVDAKPVKAAYESRPRVVALENLLRDCCDHAVRDLGVVDGGSLMYGLTVVGTFGRMFSLSPGEALLPMMAEFADGSGGNGDGYRDAAEDVWNEAFRLVKAMPPARALANPL